MKCCEYADRDSMHAVGIAPSAALSWWVEVLTSIGSRRVSKVLATGMHTQARLQSFEPYTVYDRKL
jgi:hypothetical protein